MKAIKSAFIVVLVVAAGCTVPANRVLVTPAPGVKTIPSTIAVYPLLTTEYVHGRHPRPTGPPPQSIKLLAPDSPRGEGEGTGEDGKKEGIYILPPTESRLVVNSNSQLFSDLLAAELANDGFKIKQLPVEAPVANDGGQKFFVSMDLLERLRDEFGLQAVLLGNVYFSSIHADPADSEVHAAYVKVVDVNTLDVLCHVSVTNDFYGTDVSETVARIADELAALSSSAPADQ